MGVAALFLLTLIVTAAAGVSDYRRMIIPNSYSLLVIGFFAAAFWWAPDQFGPWWHHLLAFAIFFAVTFVMFIYGIMGGGDTKFGSALALWVGLKPLLLYMFYMSIVGGLLAALTIYLRRRKPVANPQPGSWIARAQEGKSTVPYGIAIGIGAVAALFHTGKVNNLLHEVISLAY